MVYNLNNICTKTSWYKTVQVDGLYNYMNLMNENGDLAFAIASNISYIAFLIGMCLGLIMLLYTYNN